MKSLCFIGERTVKNMPNYWTNPYSPTSAQTQYQQRPLIDWVVGKASADAYPMAPNGKVMLMDTQEPIVYVKTTDPMGRPTIVVFDLVERKVAEAEPANSIDYDRIRTMIAEEVKKAIPSTKKSKKEED